MISQGHDYEHIEELIQTIEEHNLESVRNGGIVVACGMARFEDDTSVASVFRRADMDMYANKQRLKGTDEAGNGETGPR